MHISLRELGLGVLIGLAVLLFVATLFGRKMITKDVISSLDFQVIEYIFLCLLNQLEKFN